MCDAGVSDLCPAALKGLAGAGLQPTPWLVFPVHGSAWLCPLWWH